LPKPIRISEQQWPESTVPLVSIRCITYNHVNFIRDAIEGFLMQETTFPVEILIHDDASTDGTIDIILGYCEKFPSLIQAYIQPENTYSKPNRRSYRRDFNSLLKGKYIATCEGDDYWLTGYKLEKQINFLERNPDASFCFHNAVIFDERSGKARLFSDCAIDCWHQLEELIERNFIATASKVARKSMCPKVHKPDEVKAGDWVANFTAAEMGKFYYFREVMSVYRLHGAGVWTSMRGVEKLNQEIQLLEFLKKISKYEKSIKFEQSISRRRNASSFFKWLKIKFVKFYRLTQR